MNTLQTLRGASRAWIASAAILIGLLVPSVVWAQEKTEAAPTSQLTGITLPGSARHLIDPETLAQITPQLEVLAANAKKRSSSPEVLIWTGNHAASKPILKAVETALEKAGYTCEAQTVPGDTGDETRALTAEKGSQQVAGIWIITTDYLLLAWCQLLDPALDRISSSPVPAPERQVLVPGDPPLTLEQGNRFNRFLEWVLDAPLTIEQRDLMQKCLVDAWKNKDKGQMDTALQMLKLHDQVMALTEEQRSLLLAKAQPELLKDWRQQTHDETTRWMLAIYDAAHKPIAPGNPPLTRQVCDAYVEVTAFMVREVTGKSYEVSRVIREATAKTMASHYGKFSADQQLQLSRFPMLWAALRTAWPKASEEERAGLRRQWAEMLTKLAPQPQVSAQAEKAMQELEALVPKIQREGLTPEEKRYAADRMEIVAAELRRLGGEENAASAARWLENAKAFRQHAQAAANPVASQQAYEHLIALQRKQHNAYVSMYNASLTSHAGTMNMLSIMSGSPYRYSVR